MQAQKSVQAEPNAPGLSTVRATILSLLITTGTAGLIALIYDLVIRGLGV